MFPSTCTHLRLQRFALQIKGNSLRANMKWHLKFTIWTVNTNEACLLKHSFMFPLYSNCLYQGMPSLQLIITIWNFLSKDLKGWWLWVWVVRMHFAHRDGNDNFKSRHSFKSWPKLLWMESRNLFLYTVWCCVHLFLEGLNTKFLSLEINIAFIKKI